MDIFSKYKRSKKMNTFSIIAVSLVLALSINIFVLSWSNISSNIKSNILESEKNNNIGDLYFEEKNNDLILKTSNNINNIENISISFAYNPENLEIKNIIPKLNWEVSNISNTPWLNTVIVEYTQNHNIFKNDTILTLEVNKKEEKTENINIISANFTDTEWKSYELSTNWTTF